MKKKCTNRENNNRRKALPKHILDIFLQETLKIVKEYKKNPQGGKNRKHKKNLAHSFFEAVERLFVEAGTKIGEQTTGNKKKQQQQKKNKNTICENGRKVLQAEKGTGKKKKTTESHKKTKKTRQASPSEKNKTQLHHPSQKKIPPECFSK